MNQLSRRTFLAGAAAAGAYLNAQPAAAGPARRQILNFNENMEYRRLGKTGLMVSAVGLGGHWKRMGAVLKQDFHGEGFAQNDMRALDNRAFMQNRHDVVSRCIELGINYIDACSGPEVMVYSQALKGRRDKVHLGYSWGFKESRQEEWRSSRKLTQSLDEGLRAAHLDYVDVWRISLPMDGGEGLSVLDAVEAGAVEAMQMARKQGKARFTGVSTHNRIWLNYLINAHPDDIQVALFPYTANTKQMPNDSVFDAIKKHDTGVFGIKPFADNALFQGNSAPESPSAEEDSRRARLALRYILGTPGITAPIPGLASMSQVENAAKAVMERRRLDLHERAQLKNATDEMWTKLSPSHRWLKNWEYV